MLYFSLFNILFVCLFNFNQLRWFYSDNRGKGFLWSFINKYGISLSWWLLKFLQQRIVCNLGLHTHPFSLFFWLFAIESTVAGLKLIIMGDCKTKCLLQWIYPPKILKIIVKLFFLPFSHYMAIKLSHK